MTDVTHILSRIESGDPSAANELLPLVYEELRRLAAAKMARESPGQTLQATALVHEAWMKLVGVEPPRTFANRHHFFSAAGEAMRQILVDQARRKLTVRHGGQRGQTGRRTNGAIHLSLSIYTVYEEFNKRALIATRSKPI